MRGFARLASAALLAYVFASLLIFLPLISGIDSLHGATC